MYVTYRQDCQHQPYPLPTYGGTAILILKQHAHHQLTPPETRLLESMVVAFCVDGREIRPLSTYLTPIHLLRSGTSSLNVTYQPSLSKISTPNTSHRTAESANQQAAHSTHKLSISSGFCHWPGFTNLHPQKKGNC